MGEKLAEKILRERPEVRIDAPDPSSQIAGSIGGNVAENAAACIASNTRCCFAMNRCMSRKNDIESLHRSHFHHAGPERVIVALPTARNAIGLRSSPSQQWPVTAALVARSIVASLALFTGSEGMLGIIVEVTVKLIPKPQSAKVLLASFDDVGKAGAAVAMIIGGGIIPGGLEMMDQLALRAAEDFVHAGYPVDAEAILLCELDGAESDVNDDIQMPSASAAGRRKNAHPGGCRAACHRDRLRHAGIDSDRRELPTHDAQPPHVLHRLHRLPRYQ
ncbi:MAG: hypothetical protein WDW38_006419 [Sanguina aurantia]